MSRNQVRRTGGASGLGTDDSGCFILHVDMDAFYASVSLRNRPDLVGTPVIVGGASGRSVVLSATYEARALGVHSAMPMSRARRLAPQAVIIEPTHSDYAEVSRAVMAIFESITPLVEPLSLDEAFLDVSGALRRIGSPTEVAQLIRARVHTEQLITCSVGVASTKFVAKLASTVCKPDGLLVVPAAEVLDFLHPLPVGALWGVGQKTEEQLTRMGLRTVADIAEMPLATLKTSLGQATGEHLYALSWGRDPRSVNPNEREKSVSNEETFEEDVDDPTVIHAHLLRLSDAVAGRLRSSGHVGRTVSLKLRFADFRTITRSRTLAHPTDVGQEIYNTARSLFDALALDRVLVRLVGVRMEGLVDASEAPQQLTLDEPEHGHRDAELAIDALRARYGSHAVRSARLVDSEPRESPDRGDATRR